MNVAFNFIRKLSRDNPNIHSTDWHSGPQQKCIHSSFHRNVIVVVHCIPFKIYILRC